MGFTAAVVRDRSGIRVGRDLACDARIGEHSTPALVMWRRFLNFIGIGRGSFGFLQALAQCDNLARQDIDLEPLVGNRFVQRLNGLILKHQSGLERVDPLANRFQVAHSIYSL